MQLAKKKQLAAKVLGVGKGRIIFIEGRESEIKEAITRQDIIDLKEAGAIQIKEVCGRKKIVRRKNQRKKGKIKKRTRKNKQEYVNVTRKMRTFAKFLLKTGEIENEDYRTIRKKIKSRDFKSKRNLKENYKEL